MTVFKRLGDNQFGGRDLVVGDICGDFDGLAMALLRVDFDPFKGDRLFSVGNLVGHAPDSLACFDMLLEPWFEAVLGSNELAVIKYVEGDDTIQVGDWLTSMEPIERVRVANLFKSQPIAIEVGRVGIVHADCMFGEWQMLVAALESGYELDTVRNFSVLAPGRFVPTIKYVGVDGIGAVIVGHNPVRAMARVANVINVETSGWRRGGHYSVVDMGTLKCL